MYGFRLKVWNFENCYKGSDQQYSSIGLENAIIWKNNGLIYWLIYASLGLNEF